MNFIQMFGDLVLPIVVALLASSSFWMFLDKKTQRTALQIDLLKGLAHDRIVFLGMSYVKRGYIFHDEYENLVMYLYKPYQNLGGNGSVLRVMEEVNKLPMKYQSIFIENEKGE